MTPSSPEAVVRSRLEALMPKDAVDAFLRELLVEAGLGALRSADDQLAIAEVLCRRRGALAMLGRSLKIDALFAGASAVRSAG